MYGMMNLVVRRLVVETLVATRRREGERRSSETTRREDRKQLTDGCEKNTNRVLGNACFSSLTFVLSL